VPLEAASMCPGCDAVLPFVDGPVHPYMTSSPACWQAFGEVLAADYSSPERMAFHQLVVDAFAAQHPGAEGRKEAQSVGLHLMTLCLFLEDGVDPKHGTGLHRKMIGRPVFTRLQRTGPGALTVQHVPLGESVERTRQAAYEWATAVWDSYAGEHATVRRWLEESGVAAEESGQGPVWKVGQVRTGDASMTWPSSP
jgi:hypothetical protein